MKQRMMFQALAGLAVCGLGMVVATDALAQTFVERPVVAVSASAPFGCSVEKNQFVIDEDADTCSGISTQTGPGWEEYGFSSASMGYYTYVTRVRENGSETAVWSPNITIAGTYEVWVGYRSSENRTTAAPFLVYTDEGANYRFTIDQRGNGSMAYAKLGTFKFDKRAASANPKSGYVKLVNEGRNSSEGIDAAYFRLVKPTVINPLADTVPVPGDYDGDGEPDLAVYHSLTGKWDIRFSDGRPSVIGRLFGSSKAVPVPGNYDEDRTTDLAVYYPATGKWDVDYSGNKPTLKGYKFGWWEDTIPVPRDYDGDGKTEMALYRRQEGLWYIDFSRTGETPLGRRIIPIKKP